MPDQKTPTERLDSHARAMRAMKARIEQQAAVLADLSARLDALEATRVLPSSTSPSPGSADTETFVPHDECAMCGETKPVGRKALTCPKCATLRNTIIRDNLDRAPITSNLCFSCKTTKPATTAILCAPCSRGFRVWKGGVR